MKANIIFLFVAIFFFQTSQVQAQSKANNFLTKEQVKDFYNQLITDIELLDAEGIETRNESRDVNWKKFKKHYKKQFYQSKTWDELETTYTKFGKGFVNLHSSFKFFTPNKKKTENLVSSIRLGFENPKMAFFERKTKKNITHVNKIPINKVFNYFLNYECSFNSDIGCQSSFINQLHRGNVLVNGEKVKTVRFENGEVLKITFEKPKPRKKVDTWSILEKKYADWKVVKKGYKVAVLKKENVALVKISSFVFKKGSGRDFRCTKSRGEGSMCEDIILMRKALDEIKDETDYLILDVQNNTGGNENTAFVAEFAQKPFYDLRVRYKKTDLLKDAELRKFLFYFSSRAESWYQNLLKDGTIEKW